MKMHTVVDGTTRTLTIDGATYSYGRQPNARPQDDQFMYTLPDGKSYSHPTREGCLLAILKDMADEGFTYEVKGL